MVIVAFLVLDSLAVEAMADLRVISTFSDYIFPPENLFTVLGIRPKYPPQLNSRELSRCRAVFLFSDHRFLYIFNVMVNVRDCRTTRTRYFFNHLSTAHIGFVRLTGF